MTETKIFADENRANAKLLHEDLFDEFGWRELRKLDGEGLDHGGFEADDPEPIDALVVGRKTARSGIGTKNFQRRRLEGEGGGDIAGNGGAMRDVAQDFLVAEMNAVEVSDGQNAAAMKWSVVGVPCFGRMENCERSGIGQSDGNRRTVFDFHAKLEAVVAHLNVGIAERAETRIGFFVRKFMRDVREPCSARL